MRRTVRIVQSYPQPPEKIWQALTDPALLAAWLMPNDFRPVVGHRFQFKVPPQHGWRGIVDCEVLSVDAPRQLAYSWLGDVTWKEPTVVTWTLAPDNGGTLLTLEHSNFMGLGGFVLSFMLGNGWKKMLRTKFVNALNQQVVQPSPRPAGSPA